VKVGGGGRIKNRVGKKGASDRRGASNRGWTLEYLENNSGGNHLNGLKNSSDRRNRGSNVTKSEGRKGRPQSLHDQSRGA